MVVYLKKQLRRPDSYAKDTFMPEDCRVRHLRLSADSDQTNAIDAKN